ncbi:MAG TPA: hypothetical protein VHK69_21200 [Chitinophagaceae bacterium]|jgi:hypothetical protein|nr:hypothetical protein [Chitinophagaceae bacterium]
MKKITTLLLLTAAATIAQAQLLIQPGAGLKATGNVQIVLHNTQGTNNDPASDLTDATVVVTGNAHYGLNGSAGWKLRGLVVDKGSASLLLGSPLQIGEKIRLQSGLLNLNGQVATLQPSAVVEGETAETRITGPSGGSIRITLPLNAPAGANPGNLGASVTSAANLGTVTLIRTHKEEGSGSGLKKVLRFYEFQPANNTGLNATLRFRYLVPELNTLTENTLELFGRANTAVTWSRIGGTRNTGEHWVEASGLASLRQFALSVNGSPLPLFWGPLAGACTGGTVAVEWTTIEEKEVAHFQVQGRDGSGSWKSLATVPAIGNTSGPHTYRWEDPDALAGSNRLYRFLAVDEDGTQHLSPLLSVRACGAASDARLAPVPATTSTVLHLQAPAGYTATLVLLGADGRALRQQTVAVRSGSNAIPVSLQGLAAGSYYLQVTAADGSRLTLPLIKQ